MSITSSAIAHSRLDLALPAAGPPVSELVPWLKANATLEAIRLIELGARAGMVSQLTGMDKTTANRLYRQIHRQPSPPGQSPFTDTWYLKSEYRMLHASLVWNLFRRFRQAHDRPARDLIEVYEVYLALVQEPLLDITHVAFVPQLMAMPLWEERVCQICHGSYVEPLGSPGITCPACRLYQSFRCPNCGAAVGGYRRGRRRTTCPACGWTFKAT